MSEPKWYVIHTYSGYENKVADSIEKIVVDTRVASQSQVSELKNKIAQQGLDIKLYDMNGVEL